MTRLPITCVYLSPFLLDRDSGGGLVSRLNLECLRRNLSSVDALVLSNEPPSEEYRTLGAPRARSFTALCNALLLCGRLTPLSLFRILIYLIEFRPGLLFVESSSLGWVALLGRFVLPRSHVLVFCQNVEFDFQVARARVESPGYFLSAVAEFINEWLVARTAHTLVVLTQEDSDRFLALYSRAADAVMPVSLERKMLMIAKGSGSDVGSHDAVLFVGSNFFANRQAARYLVEELAPRLDLDIWIAGAGFTPAEWGEALPSNVHMLGRVEDLATLYGQARAVVAPVMSGAGMKVKVAEALMFGCPVIGSPLALRGYLDSQNRPHLQVATTPEQYRQAIANCSSAGSSLRDQAYQDYVDRFSFEAAIRRIREVLEVRVAGRD
jgi:hypothetical protein